MDKCGYYHLFSDGFRADFLFEDKSSFIFGMNMVALCFLKSRVEVIAFCLMDNHVHFILYGTVTDCICFKDKFLHQYGLWYSNRYEGKCCQELIFDIKLMDDERYILTSIAYVLRNGIAAGFRFCADDYEWSSNGLYFRDPERLSLLTSGWKKISDMTIRERRHFLKTRAEIPPEWLVTQAGFIWPGNYVNYKHAESLYRSPKSFAFFMGQRKEDEINNVLGIHNSVCLPDIELREKAVNSCIRLFGTADLRALDVKSRIVLAKELRKDYYCSFKQIARIVHLHSKYLAELV